MSHLYDYSFARPDPAAMASVPGCVGVIRYLSGGGPKDITADEAARLHAAGLGILLVWEQSGTREEQGYAAGVADAQAAQAQARAVGYPDTCPIFFADDNNDADPTQENAYMDGVLSVRECAGEYGNGLVVQGALERGMYGWLVETWRPGGDPHLTQLANTKNPTIPGVPESSYDTNTLNRPVPMWGGSGDDVTPEQMAQLGQWMQDQRKVTVDAVQKMVNDQLGVWMQQQSANVVDAVTKHITTVAAAGVDVPAVVNATCDEIARRMTQ